MSGKTSLAWLKLRDFCMGSMKGDLAYDAALILNASAIQARYFIEAIVKVKMGLR